MEGEREGEGMMLEVRGYKSLCKYLIFLCYVGVIRWIVWFYFYVDFSVFIFFVVWFLCVENNFLLLKNCWFLEELI